MDNQRNDQIQSKFDYNMNITQIWPGKNQFLCKNKLVCGPFMDSSCNMIVWIIQISLPSIYFIYLGMDVYYNKTAILPILQIFFWINSLLFLFLTQSTDPGIIPRKSYIIESNLDTPYSVLYQDLDDMSQELQIEVQKNLDFCSTCLIYRPPRASHCSLCDNCVMVLDHHCPYINNCIGKRNYQFFFLFITNLILLMISLFIGIIVSNSNIDYEDSNVAVILITILAVLMMGVGTLFVFQTFLIIKGKTTREIIKKKDQKQIQFIQNQENLWFKLEPSLIFLQKDQI